MGPSRELIVGVGIGLTVGSLLFMTLYALYLYGLNRDRAYLFYALYSGINCYQILLQSFFLELIFPLSTDNLYIPDVEKLSYVPYCLFMAKLVELSRTSPQRWQYLIGALILYTAVCCYLISDPFYRPYSFSNALAHFLHSVQLFNLYLVVLNLPIGLLLSFLGYSVWRSQNALKGHWLGMIGLTIATLAGPVLYHSIPAWSHSDLAVESSQPPVDTAKPIPGQPGVYSDSFMLPVSDNIANTFTYLGLTLQGFCFALALAYRGRRIEQENTRIQATFTRQLQTELEQRTSEVLAQQRLLEAQRLHQLTTDFEQKQAETEMAALRAQMNPHFIFNCLNSIKLYAIDNEAAKASEYLTKFARLIRLVLENSRANKVTLEDELEALQLYLDMEALRFEDKLHFQIQVDPRIDLDFVEIPPLLIQPYVENAIWHGLMHKPEGGTVWIDVNQLKEHQLTIRIKDNGVGRAKAVELNSKSATKRKSFGMKLTSERIGLINQLYQAQTVAQIQDLRDEQGEPAGTEVVLQIAL